MLLCALLVWPAAPPSLIWAALQWQPQSVQQQLQPLPLTVLAPPVVPDVGWVLRLVAVCCAAAGPLLPQQAVKAFIRSPDIFQCDFWELPAVQQLSNDKSSAALLQLLDVMLQGDLQGAWCSTARQHDSRDWGAGASRHWLHMATWAVAPTCSFRV